MEMTQAELQAIALATKSEFETQIQQLMELQLCIVGGGQGDITLG